MSGLVDTGAALLRLPPELVAVLGLGRRSRPSGHAGPVTVRIGDRSAMPECHVGEVGSDVVIGHVVLTLLDLRRRRRPPGAAASGRAGVAAAVGRNRGMTVRIVALVALSFCTGLRRSEVAALHWQDGTATERPGQLRGARARLEDQPRVPTTFVF